MAQNFPVGFRFRPSEVEILYLLWLKVRNQLDRMDEVPEKVLYGKDATPWNIFSDDDPWQIIDENSKKNIGTKRMVYAFTRLTKIGDKKTVRTAGSGTWDGETKPTIIKGDCDEIIGTRKMLSYCLNSGSEAVKGGWIMHEYSLAGASLNGINNADYVICRIIRDDSKYTKVKVPTNKRVAAMASQEEVGVQGVVAEEANDTNSSMLPTKAININAVEDTLPPKDIMDGNSTEVVTDEWLADGLVYFFSSFANLQKAI